MRMPTEEARSLRLGAGMPVLQLVRTACADSGRAVEVCDTVTADDRCRLSRELPAQELGSGDPVVPAVVRSVLLGHPGQGGRAG